MSFGKKITLGAIIALTGFAGAFAQYSEEEFFASHKEYANKYNDAASRFNMGWMLEFGKGTNQNRNAAIAEYTKAANGGNKSAQFYMGMISEERRNYKQAVNYYQKAVKAEKGQEAHEGAMFKLAECYEYGRGVKQNWAEAAKWYKAAADKRLAVAQLKYGICLAMGKGVKQSWAGAANYYRAAANQGHPEAQYNLGWCYEKGQGVKQSWKEAVIWYLKAADARYGRAQFVLAECYAKGRGVAANKDWAVYWYRRAASNGVKQAEEALKAYGLN